MGSEGHVCASLKLSCPVVLFLDAHEFVVDLELGSTRANLTATLDDGRGIPNLIEIFVHISTY